MKSVTVRRTVTDPKNIEYLSADGLVWTVMAAKDWFDTLDRANVCVHPADAAATLNIINSEWIEDYIVFSMAELLKDFVDNFCLYPKFRAKEEKHLEQLRDEATKKVQEAEMNRNQVEHADELTEAIDAIKLAMEYRQTHKLLQNEMDARKAQRNSQRIDQFKHDMHVTKMAQEHLTIRVKTSLNCNDLREAQAEADAIAVTEIDACLFGWMTVNPVIDNNFVMSGAYDGNHVRAATQTLLTEVQSLHELGEKILETQLELEQQIADYEACQTEINIYNLLRTDRNELVEYQRGLEQVFEKQTQLLTALEEVYANEDIEAMKPKQEEWFKRYDAAEIELNDGSAQLGQCLQDLMSAQTTLIKLRHENAPTMARQLAIFKDLNMSTDVLNGLVEIRELLNLSKDACKFLSV